MKVRTTVFLQCYHILVHLKLMLDSVRRQEVCDSLKFMGEQSSIVSSIQDIVATRTARSVKAVYKVNEVP